MLTAFTKGDIQTFGQGFYRLVLTMLSDYDTADQTPNGLVPELTNRKTHITRLFRDYSLSSIFLQFDNSRFFS
jgi:hypothetical protein